jgi:transcriptional regulator with XRE-family HTH domain
MMSGSTSGPDFGEIVRRGREQAGLTQARLAEFIGKSPSALRSWEQGRSRPAEVASVRALAAVLGLNEAELIETAGFEPSPQADPRPTLEQELISLASDRTVLLPVADPHGWSRPSPFDPDPDVLVEELKPSPLPVPAAVNNGSSPAARKVTTVAPPVPFFVQSPSYVEDTEEREFYRRRWALTAGITVFLVVVFLWALDNTFGAIGDFISDFVESFNI